MLLVRDDEAELRELHTVREERVRADDDVDIMRGNAIVHRLPLFRCEVSREEADANARPCELLRERVIMLAREDFRRRHECALATVLDRLDEREEREHGLARADVALHEAAHRRRLLHVAADVPPSRRLPGRQRKRQAL